jgi:hypothetical protein
MKSVYLLKDEDMAKWVLSTPPPFTGTKYGVTVYQLRDDTYFVRMKSAITGERIKIDPVFKDFRKSSGRMREASPIASFVYKQLRVKHYPLYREMTGKAILWLKEGVAVDVIKARLMREYIQDKKPRVRKLKSRGNNKLFKVFEYSAASAIPKLPHEYFGLRSVNELVELNEAYNIVILGSDRAEDA